MPISPWYCIPEREFNYSSCSEWNKLLKRFSGCAAEDQTLNHNLVNISFFKIDELGLVGKCVKRSFRIYMGCYLQFCITKKLRPVNKNLSKEHFFHILSPHAKGLRDVYSTRGAKKKVFLGTSSTVILLEKNHARNVGQFWNLAGIFLDYQRIIQT